MALVRVSRRLSAALSVLGVIASALAFVGPSGAAGAADEDTAAVPIAEIAIRAEEVQASLRRLQSAAITPPAVAAIESQVGPLQERITRGVAYTDWLLESRPSFPTLERLAGPWERTRRQLVEWNTTLTRRATQLQEEIDRLDALRGRWTTTRAEARKADTPPQVAQRIDELVTAIGQTHQLVRAQRSAIVLLQDRVADQTGRCDQVLTRLERLRHELMAGVVQRGGAPVWSQAFYSGWPSALRQGLDDIGPLLGRGLRYVVVRSPWLTVLAVVALLVLTALLWRAERDPAVSAALGLPADPAPSRGCALGRALAGAWLAVLLATWLIDPTGGSPVDVREIALVVPVSWLLSARLDRRWWPLLYAFGALFLMDRLRNGLWRQPLGEQAVLLLEMLAAIGLMAWLLAERRRAAARPAPARLVDVAARALLVVWAGALAAGAAGYVSLASLIGGGAVSSTYLALAFYGAVLVAERLAALALEASPVTRLQAVRRRPALVLEKTRMVLGWLAIATWIWVTLDAQGLLEPTAAAARAVLGARLEWGALSVSLGDLLAFGLTVWAAFLISAVVRFFLEEDVFQAIGFRRGVPYALSRLLHYTILVVGFTVGVGVLGVDLNKVTVLAGAFGVGIGFGLQNVVSNFISGVILLMERPVNVGDAVQLGELGGEVRRIGMRASVVHTWDGAEVIVPNAQLISEKVVNWTLSDRRRRLTIKIAVVFGTDPERVIALLRDAAERHPRILRQPAPAAVFQGFGENGLDFELWVWIERFEEGGGVQSELYVAVNAALAAAGIEIASPQRVVHLREMPAPPPST